MAKEEPPTGWTAKRFTQKPLRQPTYDFRDVPKCARDLTGSSLHFLTEREHLVEAMSEMVLLCIEAIRRNKGNGGKKRASKPLSLEYMADRLDVDDPICGYLIRTNKKPSTADVCLDKWEMGMLQGFITVTTFTNWQKSFRWDSMHDSAFAYDDEHLAEQMASGERKYDADGSLAKALQATVRSGDPWEEGIVWPRIAEISLLGGLGCGKVLVSLAVEHLEHLKTTGKANYDYVVLQATDNSIPFYESMGFVRVGAVTVDDKFNEKQPVEVCETSSHSSDADEDDDKVPLAQLLDDSSSSDKADRPVVPEIVSSPTILYTTEKLGEMIKDIAKRFHADPWDTVFLNHHIHEGLTPSSRIIKGTVLRIPCPTTAPVEEAAVAVPEDVDAPKWYIARENDTPRMIAKKFSVNCIELVEANKGRLPELLPVSRLKEGTRIKVSHFHIHDDMHVPYCHWTFPDDDFDSGEPSYMMVRKLNRQSDKQRPVEASLAVPISPYDPPRLLMPETMAPQNQLQPKDGPKAQRPKRPPSSFMMFVAKQRETRADEFRKMRLSDVSQKLSAEWKLLADSEKKVFIDAFQKLRTKYVEAKEKYSEHLSETAEAAAYSAAAEEANSADSQDLFNKVVRLKPGALRDESEYTYWYVLTYIPDLKWCHLGPLYSNGIFGPDKPKSQGRTKWRLVDEKMGKELDISATFCIPVKSKALKKTQDADKEEWDIIEPVRRTGSACMPSRTSPRRKSKLPDTLREREPSESRPKSINKEILGASPPPPLSFPKIPAAMIKGQQLKKAVFSSKRASRGGIQNDPTSCEKKLSKLADVTATQSRSVVVRLTMSSNDPSKKSSETFLEEPLVALCAGKGVSQHEPASAEHVLCSSPKASRKHGRPARASFTVIDDKARLPRTTAGNIQGKDSSANRPKRKVAPDFLGESPSSVETPFRMPTPRARAAIKPLGGMVKRKAKRSLDGTAVNCQQGTNAKQLSVERPKRKGAPEFIDDQNPRKRHTLKNATSRRSV